MKSAVVLALASVAFSAPTRTVENRGLPGLGSGTDSALDALKSLIPDHPGSFSDLPSLPHFSGHPSLPALSDLPGLGGSGGPGSLTTLPTDLPSLSDLFSPSKEEATPTEKRQLPGFASGSSGLSSLESLIPSAGSSDSGSGLSALESLIPSLEPSGLGFKARRDISEIVKRQLGGTTQNGVTSKVDCKELTFIFARGTGELGNMGSVVGPEVANQLESLTSNQVTVQGVTYSADAAGNAMLGANGGPIMAKLVKQALSQCPKTKVVLGGYSQGAMVVHNAARSLSSGQISGAVLFGDPFKAQSVANLSNDKRKEFCAAGDPVCENGFNVMAHLTYGSDAKTAAQFLVGAAGLS